MAHTAIPASVGTRADTPVHFQLCVSLRIVSSVVEHGQCIKENNIVHSAVIHVQPLSINSAFRLAKSSSIMLPVCM